MAGDTSQCRRVLVVDLALEEPATPGIALGEGDVLAR